MKSKYGYTICGFIESLSRELSMLFSFAAMQNIAKVEGVRLEYVEIQMKFCTIHI